MTAPITAETLRTPKAGEAPCASMMTPERAEPTANPTPIPAPTIDSPSVIRELGTSSSVSAEPVIRTGETVNPVNSPMNPSKKTEWMNGIGMQAIARATMLHMN